MDAFCNFEIKNKKVKNLIQPNKTKAPTNYQKLDLATKMLAIKNIRLPPQNKKHSTKPIFL